MRIDAEAIAGMFASIDGFRHPDWPRISDWVRCNVADSATDTWNEIVRIWVKGLCDLTIALEVLGDVALGLLDHGTTAASQSGLR